MPSATQASIGRAAEPLCERQRLIEFGSVGVTRAALTVHASSHVESHPSCGGFDVGSVATREPGEAHQAADRPP